MTQIEDAYAEAQAEQDARLVATAQDAITELLGRYVELHGVTAAGSGAPADTSGIRGSRGLDLPTPVRIDVVDVIALIEEVTRDLASISRLTLRLGPEVRSQPLTSAQLVHVRLGEVGRRLPHVWEASRVVGLDCARRAWDLHQRAGQLLGLSVPAFRLAGATCPACGVGETLWVFPYSWETVCGNPSCGERVPVGESALAEIAGTYAP